MNQDELNRREQLLRGALGYVRALRAVPIVKSITLFGSITTGKPYPNDVDLLIVLVDTINLKRLENGDLDCSEEEFNELVDLNNVARSEKRNQHQQQIADLFVATCQYEYIGGLSLDYDSFPLIRRNYRPLDLSEVLSKSCQIELWPEIRLKPQDVLQYLIRPLHEEDGVSHARI